MRDPGQRHRLRGPAAQQPPDRLAEELAAQVPQRDVDQRFRRAAVADTLEAVEDREVMQRIDPTTIGLKKVVDHVGDGARVLAGELRPAHRFRDAFGAVVKADDDDRVFRARLLHARKLHLAAIRKPQAMCGHVGNTMAAGLRLAGASFGANSGPPWFVSCRRE